MSAPNFEDQLRRHYARRVDESGAVERLQAALSACEEDTPRRKPRRLRVALAIAATVVVGTALAVLFLRPPGVAAEIAANHRKTPPAVFETSSLDALQARLADLDFRLQAPDGPAAGLHVVGGRYCSVRGALAAQLRLHDDSGRVYTWYQTRRTPRLEPEAGRDELVDGVRVRTWSSQELFLCLAEWHDTHAASPPG